MLLPMVRRVVATALVVLLAWAAAACTGGGSTTGPPAPPPASTTTTATTTARQTSAPPVPATAAAVHLHPKRLTVVMSGDVLLHEELWATARADARRTGRGRFDFRPVLADMRPVIAGADLAICHLETPLAPRGGPFSGYPTFAVPPAILPALKWAGYDACTTASNHSLDDGYAGLARTIHDFDRVGLAHAGTATTRRAARRALMLHVHGITVALIAATYGTNGIPLPGRRPWSVPIIDPARITAMAHRARHHGADIVLVALHWGEQYENKPSAAQVQVAEQLTRSDDIDLVYGHHAHVVQPYDRVGGTWVLYGLGNAVAAQSTPLPGLYDGNTARVTFTRQRNGRYAVTRLQYIPTLMTRYDEAHPQARPMRWLDVNRHLHDPAYARLHDALVTAQQRVRRAVNLDGALAHGVTDGR